MVGHTLALLLARDRLRVALVSAPRPASGIPDVRAYALNTAARDLLRSVRAWPEDSAAPAGSPLSETGVPTVTPVSGMQVYGDHGGALQFSAIDQGSEALTWIVDVPALEQRLAHAVHFQSGIECLTEAPPAALTVICEGKRSATRDELGLTYEVRPYPHKADHVFGSEADIAPHTIDHPIFFGSFDWHSCVHGYWTLATLLRLYPDMPQAPAIRALFDDAFTPAKVAVERAYLDRPGSRGFERPYGWAWLLMLQAGPDVVRLAPSLVIDDADIDEGLDRLERAVATLTQA